MDGRLRAVVSRICNKAALLASLFTALAIAARLVGFIATPLWLDAFVPEPYNLSQPGKNNTNPFSLLNSTSQIEQNDAYFNVVLTTLTPTILWGIVLLCIMVFKPASITDQERKYPKSLFFIPGCSQALSSVLITYALSGTRTPPYLQAVLNNFTIPIQFIVRFIILRKRPTCRKLVCACIVIVAELMCLLTSIFPSLENASQHEEEGGTSGPGRVLWPLCFVASQIPYALANTIIEKGVKDKKPSNDRTSTDASQLNMVYYMFWFSLALFIGSITLFWTDIIPGFGNSPNITAFGQKIWFNIQCIFGQAGCKPSVYLLGWANVWANVVAFVSIACLLRYSEGANYMIVAMTLRSPLLLLFWTLFQEHPFHWNPQAHLSTWLSLGALCFMIPAIVIYNTGSPEVTVRSKLTDSQFDGVQNQDRDPLLTDDTSSVQQPNVKYPNTNIQE